MGRSPAVIRHPRAELSRLVHDSSLDASSAPNVCSKSTGCGDSLPAWSRHEGDEARSSARHLPAMYSSAILVCDTGS